MKYPRTFHFPGSASITADDKIHKNPDFFVGKDVVVSEKIDGGNTLLHCGEVYARSTSAPSHDGWMAMVRKHHAWKLDPEANWLKLYGEDIYGVHSILYDPVREEDTFWLFAARITTNDQDIFCSWNAVKEYADHYGLKRAPEVFRGKFNSVEEIQKFFETELKKPSVLGPEREGFVIRIADSFPADRFDLCAAKHVRKNHVQTDDNHWRRNWKPCKIKR